MVDKLIPIAVGHRTEVTALIIAAINLLKAVKPSVAPVVDAATTVLTALAGAFFAAKVSR